MSEQRLSKNHVQCTEKKWITPYRYVPCPCPAKWMIPTGLKLKKNPYCGRHAIFWTKRGLTRDPI